MMKINLNNYSYDETESLIHSETKQSSYSYKLTSM